MGRRLSLILVFYLVAHQSVAWSEVRAQRSCDTSLIADPLDFEVLSEAVKYKGDTVKMSPTQLRILAHLYRAGGEKVALSEIAHELEIEVGTIRSQLSQLKSSFKTKKIPWPISYRQGAKGVHFGPFRHLLKDEVYFQGYRVNRSTHRVLSPLGEEVYLSPSQAAHLALLFESEAMSAKEMKLQLHEYGGSLPTVVKRINDKVSKIGLEIVNDVKKRDYGAIYRVLPNTPQTNRSTNSVYSLNNNQLVVNSRVLPLDDNELEIFRYFLVGNDFLRWNELKMGLRFDSEDPSAIVEDLSDTLGIHGIESPFRMDYEGVFFMLR